ncbi:MAG: hypothetical protein RJB39_367 [Candidatus Parcubacteria bacterium]|jgi:hypothetical protein
MKFITTAIIIVLLAIGSVLIYKQKINTDENSAQILRVTQQKITTLTEKNTTTQVGVSQNVSGNTNDGCTELYACNRKEGATMSKETKCEFSKYIVIPAGGATARKALEEEKQGKLFDILKDGYLAFSRPTKTLSVLQGFIPLLPSPDRGVAPGTNQPNKDGRTMYDVFVINWIEAPLDPDSGPVRSYKLFPLGGKPLSATAAAGYNNSSACHIDNKVMMDIEQKEAEVARNQTQKTTAGNKLMNVR